MGKSNPNLKEKELENKILALFDDWKAYQLKFVDEQDMGSIENQAEIFSKSIGMILPFLLTERQQNAKEFKSGS